MRVKLPVKTVASACILALLLGGASADGTAPVVPDSASPAGFGDL